MTRPGFSIADQLAAQGWCVQAGFVDARLSAALADEARESWDQGRFREAGVGRGAALAVRPAIRSDHVHWLNPDNPSPAQQAYLGQIEQLRLALNQTLFLGLFDFEGHLAIYPPGSCYRRHLDRFADNTRRALSTVLYLNDQWCSEDGGQLRLYTDPHDPDGFQDIMPTAGTLVTFFSDRFPHEVLAARRQRLSLAGWFRTRD